MDVPVNATIGTFSCSLQSGRVRFEVRLESYREGVLRGVISDERVLDVGETWTPRT
ncbi:MAG TPA: hypothetical protein VF950_18455 [Planctomycetota bacterium]